MFDFEKTIAGQTEVDPEQFMKCSSYLYLRSGLIERWNTLNEFQTYPNMIVHQKRIDLVYPIDGQVMCVKGLSGSGKTIVF